MNEVSAFGVIHKRAPVPDPRTPAQRAGQVHMPPKLPKASVKPYVAASVAGVAGSAAGVYAGRKLSQKQLRRGKKKK